MPIIELVAHLYGAGYRLKPTLDGNLTAVPIQHFENVEINP